MFYISDIPPEMPIAEARVMCSVEAAARYHLPADLIFAVSLTEGGKPGMSVKNTNGTFDLGYMQFNTAYLKSLKGYGITEVDVLANTCYPFHLAAWRISQHIEEDTGDDLLTRIAYYHSRTQKFNEIYQQRLVENAERFYDYPEYIDLYEKRYRQKLYFTLHGMKRKSRDTGTADNEETESVEVSSDPELLVPRADDASWAWFTATNCQQVIIPEAQ